MENLKISESPKIDGRSSPRQVHSYSCSWSGGSRLSNQGVCHVCDVLRSEKVFVNDMHGRHYSGGHDLNTNGMKDTYCKNNRNIPYARCTKHTNPKCNCGKRIYNQTLLDGNLELY